MRCCSSEGRRCGGKIIRINPREPQVPEGHISITEGALAALTAIDATVRGAGESER